MPRFWLERTQTACLPVAFVLLYRNYVMVETQSPPFFEVPDFSGLLGRGLAMAALLGSLSVLGSWWVDALRLRGTPGPVVPVVNVACEDQTAGTEDCETEAAPVPPLISAQQLSNFSAL